MNAPPATVGSKNPYPGLRPFEVEEFESFFGRDRQIDELLTRLRDHRFVAVVGLSGSGKSSLVRAGLVHRLGTSPAREHAGKWHYSGLAQSPLRRWRLRWMEHLASSQIVLRSFARVPRSC
jgi:ABC-type phosphate/phosphonate transport system ATPase subunit